MSATIELLLEQLKKAVKELQDARDQGGPVVELEAKLLDLNQRFQDASQQALNEGKLLKG
jgi:hypothetical protein